MTNLRAIQFDDSPSIDAFGRARVSTPTTLFDSKQLYDKVPLFWDEEINGTATSSHSTANAATTISVSANEDYAIRQTKMRFNYVPGKSQQILMTFVLGAATTDVEKRLGYFNTATTGSFNTGYDGIYLKQDGTTQYICQAKTGSETAVAQANWNIDTMDGNGPSGITIDWTKAQILMIDFEWLGVGRVRAGLVIDGLIYYVHEFLNANSVTAVYMQSPNHSLRYEIRSTNGSGSLVHICCSIASEGGDDSNGRFSYGSTAGTHVDAATENTLYAIYGLQLKTTSLDAVVKIRDVQIQLQTDAAFAEWLILLNPTVAGTFTYTDITNSVLQDAKGATTNTVTGGTILGGGFINSGQKSGGSSGGEVSNALRLGAKIDGTRDTIVLVARPIGGSSNIDVEGGLSWKEVL